MSLAEQHRKSSKRLPAAEKPVPEVPFPPAEKRAEPPVPEKKAEPAAGPPEAKVEKKPPEAKPEVKPLPPLSELPKFTGLVIDTRGLNIRAALIPKVLNESGQELYQGPYVPREKASQNGLALYSKDLTAAQVNPRVGKNPLTVKGFKVNPNSPSDIILSPEEAKRVAPFAQKGTFLEECKVMIVID